ncbi:MAG: immunoglobulin domain-containing protein [Lachnospiraceae bacterium]|nr:immunoglobulin domain-containing protein [Lachnospiraceae bacterium]
MKKRHMAKRCAGLFMALALAFSLICATDLTALAASDTAASDATGAAVLETNATGTLSGGETITEEGDYQLASDATGVIYIATTEPVTIIGNGAEYGEDLQMTSDPNKNLYFSCTVGGVQLTLSDMFISDTSASVPLLDLTGTGNVLTIEETVVLDMDTGYNLNAAIHVGLGDSLTINGTGTLYLYKNTQGAGFGGNSGELNGDITFGDEDSSLSVFAKGTKQGALIGAGAGASDASNSPGSVTFVEGAYNLISNSRGAVIGGSAGSKASGGTTVYVGTKANININVDYSGAAVGGGGYDGGNDSSGGILYVSGGSLRCYIDTNAAGNTTGWNGNTYTAGINDAAITEQRLNGDGEAVYWSAFDTEENLDEDDASAEIFEVYVDGELFYEGSLPEYGFVQEGLDKSEQLTITSTVSNWYKNGEDTLYFYLTGENHLVTVNDVSFICSWDSSTESFSYARGTAVTYGVTKNFENVTGSGSSLAWGGEDYTVTLTADEHYALPDDITVTVDGTELTSVDDYAYDAENGTLTVYAASITGDLEITVSGVVAEYTVSTDLSNVSIDGDTVAAVGEDYTATLTADEYYALPDDITVTAGGTELASGEGYAYDSESGSLTVYAAYITGDLEIAVSGDATSYSVSMNLSHLSIEGDTRAAVGEDYEAVLTADKYFVLPDGITVTAGDTELVSGDDYTYDSESGSLTIPAASVTGAISITAEGELYIVTDLTQDEDGSYLLYTESDLLEFADMIENATADLDARVMADITVSEDSGFAGIGTSSAPYAGTFDGNGYTVTLSVSTDGAAGLFACVSGAVIEGVTTAGTVETTVSTYGCAGLVSYVMANGVTVTECVNQADISGIGYVAGLIGRCSTTSVSVTVADSSNEGVITSTGAYAGGIAAFIRNGSVTGCMNYGDISSSGNYTGGIVGDAYSNGSLEIIECGNEGAITGKSYTGGIAGLARGSSSLLMTLDSLYNTGTVSATSYVGGVVGYSYASLSNAYNTGTVSGTGYNTGGLFGTNNLASTVISNSYNAGAVSYTLSGVTSAGGLLVGKVNSSLYKMYVDNCYYLSTLDGSISYDGNYIYNYSTQAAFSDDELAAMAVTSDELAAMAETLGEGFKENGNSDYHDGYPVLTWEEVPAAELAITSQPEDYTGSVGDTAVFEVEATGSGLTYQWQYSSNGGTTWHDSGMTGADSASVSVPVTEVRDGQKYRCVVTDENGDSVTSDAATLSLSADAFNITLQPADYTGLAGTTATFTVEADGTGLTYQWQYSSNGGTTWHDSGMGGADTAELSVKLTEARDGQQYRCVVTDEDGNSVTSDAATLSLASAGDIEITAQPSDYTGTVGDKVTFTVEATGDSDLSYQWQYSSNGGTTWHDSGMVGADAATLSVYLTSARDGQQYRCVITDQDGCTAVSDVVTMSIAE